MGLHGSSWPSSWGSCLHLYHYSSIRLGRVALASRLSVALALVRTSPHPPTRCLLVGDPWGACLLVALAAEAPASRPPRPPPLVSTGTVRVFVSHWYAVRCHSRSSATKYVQVRSLCQDACWCVSLRGLAYLLALLVGALASSSATNTCGMRLRTSRVALAPAPSN